MESLKYSTLKYKITAMSHDRMLCFQFSRGKLKVSQTAIKKFKQKKNIFFHEDIHLLLRVLFKIHNDNDYVLLFAINSEDQKFSK
jgi:hypothetical protein